MTATVDVGIPTYARPRYLVEAIESVLAQTLDGWRLTISEDGPRTEAVARAVAPHLRDPRVRYAWTGEHVGAARNLTRLIAHATAPYVALLHDDDRWGPRVLEHRVAFLRDYPECGLVCSGSTVIDGHGRQVRVTPPRVSAPAILHPAQLMAAMVRRNMVPTPTVLVRRAAYEAVGPAFDARFTRLYDYEMWLRIALRFPVGYLDDGDAFWRLHGERGSADGAHGPAAERRSRAVAAVGERSPSSNRASGQLTPTVT